MTQISINRLLLRAEEQFSMGRYESALTTYGVLLKEYPSNSAAKIGAFLCDIGMESAEEAQALFDYYQIIKSEEGDAEEVMSNLIATLDTTRDQLNTLLNTHEDRMDYEDGIRYEDFLSFAQERGNFGQAFEDVMFSTKVILKGKEEYIDFITQLIESGHKEMAEQFLESMSSTFEKSQDIYALYEKLLKK